MLQYLEQDLISNLKDAKSILIAVALIKDYGLNVIENNIGKDCERKYLVGVHLPTPPNVLRRLLELQERYPDRFGSKIHESNTNYHPKVYIIEKKSGDLIAFIGSANATRGGLSHNVEMNVAITNNEECIKLREWFNSLFFRGRNFDCNYINEYEMLYNRNKFLRATQKSNIDRIIQKNVAVRSSKVLSTQFFRQSDFDAFSPPTYIDTSPAAVEKRAKVRERLIELNEMIITEFLNYNIIDLHLPYQRNWYTSQHFHSRGHNHIEKESIWLNYGKSREELTNYNDKSFVNHMRIQVILMNRPNDEYIGIWLYIGKSNRSYEDRLNLKNRLSDPLFANMLYDNIISLGGVYWIMIGDEEIYISEIENSQQLITFLLQDDFYTEFIIGRNYYPNDFDISEDNIAETTLVEFAKLYKIYDLIKAPVKSN